MELKPMLLDLMKAIIPLNAYQRQFIKVKEETFGRKSSLAFDLKGLR